MATGFVGFVTGTLFCLRSIGNSGKGSAGGSGSPRLKRFRSQGAERTARGQMSLDVEGVVDGGVNGQESLDRCPRLEPLHLALAWWNRLIRILGPIVLAQALLMASRQPKFGLGRAVRAQLAGHHNIRRKSLFVE